MDKFIITDKKNNDRYIKCILIIIGIAIPFILYGNELMAGGTIVAGDGLESIYKIEYLQDILKDGTFPLWNPYLAGGMPQGIMVGAPALYPLNLFVALFPTTIQFALLLGIHIAIGCTFLYQYLRRINCSQLVSFAVSIMYIFTVHMGGARKEHLPLIITALYVPVIFYFAERYLQERRLKWLFCCSLAMALQFLSGFLQYIIYADIAIFLYLLTAGLHRKIPFLTMLKHGVIWISTYFGLIMGVVLGTAQFMLLLYNNSGQKMAMEVFVGLSLHPVKLLMTVFPKIFGSAVWTGLLEQGNYSSGMDIELLLGAAVVCVICSAFFLFKKSFYCRFMTGLLFIALIYACIGQFDILAKIAYHIPVLNMFRVPSRTLFLFTFAEMVLVALSLEALFREKAHQKILHYINMAMIIGFMVVIGLYSQDIIPKTEKLSLYSVFFIPCILFALYLLAFYACTYLNIKGIISKNTSKIGIVSIVLITMLVQVFPYYIHANRSNLQSLMNLSDEFVKQVGTSKVWTIDGSCDEIVSNSAVTYPIQGLNAYTNFNLPYLYQYAASSASAPMNSSGLYCAFGNYLDILKNKNDFISMMGAKYLLISPQVDIKQTAEPQITGIENNLIFVENAQLEAAADYQIIGWPVELEPNSYYKVDITISSDVADANFYVDLYGLQNGNELQKHVVILKNGCNTYSTLLFTGDCGQSENTYFRIVALTMDPMQIADVNVDKVSVSEQQLYQLKATGEKYNTYENINAKELIYAPQRVAPIEENENVFLYTQTSQYDILNTSYITGVNDASDFSDTAVNIQDIKLNNNSATALVIADGDCFVNFSQTYYPGWKAYIDGNETDVYMVNGIIQGAFVPEGTHIVEFRFVPTIFYVGTAISILTFATCIAYSIYEHKKTLLSKDEIKINDLRK